MSAVAAEGPTVARVLEWEPVLRHRALRLRRSEAGAQELLQETLARALADLEADAASPRREGRALQDWLVRKLDSTHRATRTSELRRSRREEAVARPESSIPSALAAAEQAERRRLVRGVVRKLDPEQRRLVWMRVRSGLSFREIGTRLGIREITARTRFHALLGRIETELLARHGGDRTVWALALSLVLLRTRAGRGGGPILDLSLAARLARITQATLVRAFALLAAGIGVGAMTLLWVARDDDLTASARSAAPAARVAEAGSAGAPVGSDSGAPAGISRTEETSPSTTGDATAAGVPAPAAASPPPLDALDLRGVFVREDPSGRSGLRSSGRFELSLVHRPPATSTDGNRAGAGIPLSAHRVIAVRDGEWTVRLDASFDRYAGATTRDCIEALTQGRRSEVEIDADNLDVGSAPLVLQGVEWGDDDLVQVVVRELPQPLLDVRDATTGAPLEGVTIVRVTDLLPTPLHPGRSVARETVVRAGVSPVALSDPRASGSYYVGASGHAWRTASIDLESERRIVIFLEAGGTALIRPHGEPPAGECTLIVERKEGDDDRLVLSQTVEPGVDRIDGLAPGSYVARLELSSAPNGEPYDFDVPASQAEFEIAAGVTTEVALAFPASLEWTEEFGHVRVDGSIRFDRRWEIATLAPKLALEFHPADSRTSPRYGFEVIRAGGISVDPHDPDLLHFTLADLPEGTHLLQLHGVSASWLVTIGPDRTQEEAFELALAVPAPADVEIEFRDERGGKPTRPYRTWSVAWRVDPPAAPEVAARSWFGADALETYGSDFKPASWKEQRLVLRVPEGRFEILSNVGNEAEFDEAFDVHPGANHHRIELGGHFSGALRFFDSQSGARVVPLDVRVEPVGHDGRARIGTDGRLEADRFGRYVLQVGAVPGYEPAEPHDLDLGPGRNQTIEIELEPLER